MFFVPTYGLPAGVSLSFILPVTRVPALFVLYVAVPLCRWPGTCQFELVVAYTPRLIRPKKGTA